MYKGVCKLDKLVCIGYYMIVQLCILMHVPYLYTHYIHTYGMILWYMPADSIAVRQGSRSG